jgi:flagellar hook-length control protein FliK
LLPVGGPAGNGKDASPVVADDGETAPVSVPAGAAGLATTAAGSDPAPLQADVPALAGGEGNGHAFPAKQGAVREVRPDTRPIVRAVAADSMTLAEAAPVSRSSAVAGALRGTEGAGPGGPVSVQILAELGRLLAQDRASDQSPAAGADAPTVDDSGGDQRTADSARPAVAWQALASRRLAAHLFRSSEEPPLTRSWQVAASPPPTGDHSGRQPEAASAASTGLNNGQSPLTTAGLAMPGTAVVAEGGPTGTAPTVTPAAGPADEHAVAQQIVKAIRMQWKQGLGEARIRIEPEHLGEVHISLRVQAGAVTAVVRAENPTVQGWIETRQQELRGALDQQGLRLQRFEVVVDPEGRRQPRETPQDSPTRRNRRGSATETEFEVEV